MTGALAPLAEELDAWAAAGRCAALWWRDDDAEDADDPVRRMLDLAGESGAPVFVATPPALTREGLARALEGANAAVIQHGWAHLDHSPAAEAGAWELGAHRPLEAVTAELAAGRERLSARFGPRFRPIMAPPWNRIAPEVARALPGLGFRVLSVFAGRGPGPAPGLARLDGHCDLVAWKRGRVFIGEGSAARRLAAALAAVRRGEGAGPVGLVTHVWAQEAEAWAGLAALLALISAHPAARWLRPEEAAA